MANESTEQLIAVLAGELEPVRRLASVTVRMTCWLALAVGTSAAGVWMIGPRPDLWQSVAAPGVVWSIGLLAGVSVLAAAMALRHSVPGSERSHWFRGVPLAMTVLWGGLLWQACLSVGVSTGDLLREPQHPACAALIATLALGPTLLLARSVRMGFTLASGWAALQVALAGAALAAAATQFVCPIDRHAHLLTAHAPPVAVLIAVGATVFRRLVSPAGLSS